MAAQSSLTSSSIVFCLPSGLRCMFDPPPPLPVLPDPHELSKKQLKQQRKEEKIRQQQQQQLQQKLQELERRRERKRARQAARAQRQREQFEMARDAEFRLQREKQKLAEEGQRSTAREEGEQDEDEEDGERKEDSQRKQSVENEKISSSSRTTTATSSTSSTSSSSSSSSSSLSTSILSSLSSTSTEKSHKSDEDRRKPASQGGDSESEEGEEKGTTQNDLVKRIEATKSEAVEIKREGSVETTEDRREQQHLASIKDELSTSLHNQLVDDKQQPRVDGQQLVDDDRQEEKEEAAEAGDDDDDNDDEELGVLLALGGEAGSGSSLTGVGHLLERFERPTAESLSRRQAVCTPQQARRKRIEEAHQRNREEVMRQRTQWQPLADPQQKKTLQPFRTIIVARLSYETTVETLRLVAEEYGEVEDVVIVRTPSGESRGYGFVQFAHERDMDSAYRLMDGKLIDGRAVVVDVERGRTTSSWLPRRLGGGKGTTRKGSKKECNHERGRDPPPAIPTAGLPRHPRRFRGRPPPVPGGGGGPSSSSSFRPPAPPFRRDSFPRGDRFR